MTTCPVCAWPTATPVWVRWQFHDGMGTPFRICRSCRFLLQREPPKDMRLITAPKSEGAVAPVKAAGAA